MEQTKTDIDQARLELDKWRIEEEGKFKKWQTEIESKLRQYELENKKNEQLIAILSSPISLAIIGLFTTLLVNTTQNYLQSKATKDLDRQRFESTIIEKALELPSREESAKQFAFLLDIGLISNENGKLRDYVKHPETIPNSNAQIKIALMNKAGKVNDMIVQGNYKDLSEIMVDGLKPVITNEIFNRASDSMTIILGNFIKPLDTTYSNSDGKDNFYITNQYEKGQSLNQIILDSSGNVYGIFTFKLKPTF